MLKAAASTHGNFNKWCPELVLITVCSQETKFQRDSPKMSKSNLHSTKDKAQAFSKGCNPSPFLKSLRHIVLAKNSLNFSLNSNFQWSFDCLHIPWTLVANLMCNLPEYNFCKWSPCTFSDSFLKGLCFLYVVS